MNFLQLTQAVRREAGAAGTITTLVGPNAETTRYLNWVNWAARDITLAREDWKWRRGAATVASTTAQTLTATDFGLTDFASWKRASRFYKPSAYRVTDGANSEHELQWMEYDQYRKSFLIGAPATASVQCWSISPSDEFLLGPEPDAAHFVRADYVKDYTDLSVDADIPLLPTRFHMLIVWRALMEYGGYDAAGEVFQRSEKNYTTLWTSLVQSQLEAPSFMHRSLA